MGTRLWINTAYGVDWWAWLVGQIPNNSHDFKRNENKYTCVGRSKMGRSPQGERPKFY